MRDGLAHSWKARDSAFSGEHRLETRVCVLAPLGHAAGLILSPNGVFDCLLQASGSTTWQSWGDQIRRATWHTLVTLIALWHQGGIQQREEKQTNPTPPTQEVRPEATAKTQRVGSWVPG